MSILGVAVQNMLAHEDRLIGDTTPVKPHIRAWQKQISDRIAFSRFMLSLELPLTHTAIPSLGNVVPSFTRATTATGQKWDEAGYLDFTALAGEIVWKGARRVRNLLTFTEDIGNAAWTKRETTYSGGRLIEAATTADHSVWQAASTTAGSYYVASGHAKADQNSVIQITFSSGQVSGDPKANFNLSTGALGTVDAGLTAEIEAAPDIGAGYYRLSVKAQAASTSLTAFFAMVPLPTSVRLANYAGNVSNGLYLNKMQIEDVTGQTTQAAGEYVSVGVPSDWAGTDLVTNGAFDTDTTWIKETGWTIGGGVATHAAGVSATLYQGFNFVAGAAYVFSWDTVISAGAVSLRVGGGYLIPIDFKSASGTYTATYTAVTTATDLLGFVCDAPFAGTIDNFSVKPAIYHGSMVDGVKCYDTDRSGNPISTSGSYPLVGYVPWEARTNLCLQSNAFTTTWAVSGSPIITQNVTGPDGAVSAWTLADNNAAAVDIIYNQVTTYTAAQWTISIFVKKTTGALSSYPVLAYDAQGAWAAAITIDTTNGVATPWTLITSRIVVSTTTLCNSHNEDFWRVSMTVAAVVGDGNVYILPAATASATTSTGQPWGSEPSVTGSAVFYGAQVELGSFATPYIPTTTVAVARNADLLTYTGADVANIKTLAATFSRGVGVSGAAEIANLSNLATTVYIENALTNATTLRFTGTSAGLQFQQNASNPYTPGTDSKFAVSWALNDVKIDKDGVAQTPDVSASLISGFDALWIGHFNGTLILNGPVNHIYGWTRNLSQSELGAVDRA